MDGVLKSWAIPKEIPVVPGEKRLAVEVEDHPVEYADFEGIIPEGEYGAGKVLVWDSGHYQLLKRDPKRIEFAVKGKKISGIYVLVLFRKERNNNWLFFQKHEKD
jgi:DNA ligase D-like protein (predicted 3'-phosphoesterase)